MSVKLYNETNSFEARYKENGKSKHAKFAISRHGKYAKVLAEHASQTNEVLKNWITYNDNNTISIHMYEKSTDSYYDAIIDSEDFDKVKNFHWRPWHNDTETYAVTGSKNVSAYMHRHIMEVTDPAQQVDHIKGNGLNNCKSNLRVTSLIGNVKNRVNISKTRSSTDTVGVRKGLDKRNGYYYYEASWIDINTGKQKTKKFSCNKFGDEKAYEMAKIYRKQMKKENGYINID